MTACRRIDGEPLGLCACGCGSELVERIYVRPSGSIARRSRPRFVQHHSLRVHHFDRAAVVAGPEAVVRKTAALPVGAELDATIRRRRRELGLSVDQMLALIGWAGPRGNLYRYRYRSNVADTTLRSVLDRLFADEGGWVESAPVLSLARDRLVGDELHQLLDTEPGRWMGRATARRLLEDLSRVPAGRPAKLEDRSVRLRNVPWRPTGVRTA